MKQAIKLVYFNVAFFCVLLVGLETAGQVAFAATHGYPIWQADQHLISAGPEHLFELHPWLVARLSSAVHVDQGGKAVSTTPMHTRSTGADSTAADAITIAVVGGSTTFGSGVTDTASWPFRLQRQLGPGFRVINYGVPGYSTAEGIIQMSLVVPEVRPEVVVFYEGWNDLRNYHDAGLGADYFGHGMRQYSNLDVARPAPAGFIAKLADVSAIGRLTLVLARHLAGPKAKASAKLVGPLRSDPDTLVERVYLRNLKTLRALASSLGARAIFIPQVMNAKQLAGSSGSHEWTPTLADSAIPGLMGRLNAMMPQACPPASPDCIVLTAMTQQSWSSDDFMDEGHFVLKGNEAFASVLAAQIREDLRRGAIRKAGAN